MATSAGAIEFDIGISQSSLRDAIKSIQAAFDRSGASINNLSITPQGLANVKAQVERALQSVTAGIKAPTTSAGGAANKAPSPAPAGAPFPGTAKDATDTLLSLKAQETAARSLLATEESQAKALSQQASLLSEALRFKKQLAAIRGAGLSAEDTKRAEDFARQITKLNRQKLKITAEFDGKGAIAGANRTGSVLTGIFQGVGQQITQLLVQSLTGGIAAITQFGQASLQAAGSTRSINASLTTSLGSAQAAAESYQFAKKTLDSFGASVETGTQQYAALTAASQSAGIQQELSNEFFASFSKTLALNGIAVEEQNRAFTAASQIFAKNKLSAEELRGQLAEALPSAIGIVASGLKDIGASASGSTAELNDLLESGSISAEQFAQAWIAGSSKFKGAIDPINQSIGQTQNRLFEFQQATGAALIPLQQITLNSLSSALETVGNSQAFNILGEGIKSFQESLKGTKDIADPLNQLLAQLAEGLTGLFAKLIVSVGQFVDGLSPQDIAAASSAASSLFTILGAGISVIGPVAGAIVDLGTVLNRFTNFLLNPPDWAGFFGSALQVLGAILSPLKAAAQAIENIKAATGGLQKLEANPVGDLAASTKKATDAALASFSQFTDGTKKLEDKATASTAQSANAREKANKDALKAFEQDTQQALSAIEQSQSSSIARIKQQQANGTITDTDAESQIKKIEGDSTAKIAAKDNEIAEIKRLELQGVINSKDAADRISKAQADKTNLVIASLDAEIEAQKAAQQAAIEAAETASKAAENAIAAIESKSIGDVLNQQLAGGIDAEGAAAEIAAIEAQSADARINAKEDEISRISALEKQGILSQIEATEQIKAIQLEKSQLVIDSLRAEIEAQEQANQSAIAGLDEQLNRAQELNSIRRDGLSIESEALTQQNELISAQQSLSASQATLTQQRLTATLETAKAEGNIITALGSARALAQSRQQSIEAEFTAKQKSLEISIQQNKIDAQQAILAAEIAATEAQIAVSKSQKDGSSSEEVANLQSILDVRLEQVDSTRTAAINQDKINEISQQQLLTDKAITVEKTFQIDAVNELKKAEEDLANKQKSLADEQINQTKRIVDARQSALQGLFGAISQEAGKSAEEGIKSLEAARDRLQIARNAGFFSGTEGQAGTQAAQQSIAQVQKLLNRDASDQSLANAAARASKGADGGAAFAQALQLAGRGDIASLIGADQSFADVTTAINEAQTVIAAKLDEVKTAILARDIAAAQIPDAGIPSGLTNSVTAGGVNGRIGAFESGQVGGQTTNIKIDSLSVSSPQPVQDVSEITFNLAKESVARNRL